MTPSYRGEGAATIRLKMLPESSKIYLVGHRSMVDGDIVRTLQAAPRRGGAPAAIAPDTCL